MDFLAECNSRRLNEFAYLWCIAYYLKRPWPVGKRAELDILYLLLWRAHKPTSANIFEKECEITKDGLRSLFKDRTLSRITNASFVRAATGTRKNLPRNVHWASEACAAITPTRRRLALLIYAYICVFTLYIYIYCRKPDNA